MRVLLLVLAMALTLQACGVKNRLTPPDHQPRPADQRDPSQPPYPIGR